jgi:2Fe-2S ferredoxin
MPDITLIEHDGTEHGFEAPDGLSVMQAATSFGVPGILADCGGQAVCGTCHVVVADAWITRLPPPQPAEDAMLDTVAAGRQPGSRLACQIQLQPALQGLLMHLPQWQQ